MKKLLNIRYLFSIGILLTVIPLCILMFFGKDAGLFVIIYGFMVGIGNGIYWSCRNFLTVLVTEENNRNFFTSVEQFIIIFFNALIPLLFGTLVLGNNTDEGYKMNAYKYTSLVVIFTNLFACGLILKSNFKSPEIQRFIYPKFAKIWNVQRVLTFFVGMVESGFMVLMTLLILTVAGDESVLGKIEFTTAIISVISIYIVGRISKPEHRSKIMFAGASFLIVGGITLALTVTKSEKIFNLFAISFLGVVIMKVCQVIADPMIHSSFRATYLSNIEKASIQEKRDSYTFIMDNEYFMNGGRIFGGLVFVLLTTYISKMIALQYTFIILALLQLISSYLIKKTARLSVEN